MAPPKLPDDERIARRRETQRRYSQSERGKEKRAAWLEANAERYKELQRESYERHRDKVKQRAADWAAANDERRREIRQEWKRRNPDLVREHTQRRRAQLMDAFVEPVDRRKVYLRDAGLCRICGQPVEPEAFEIDHIIPLSRGGTHEMGNVQAAHPSCNRRKNNHVEVAQEEHNGRGKDAAGRRVHGRGR